MKCYAVSPPEIFLGEFYNTPIATGTLYVPAESVETYKSVDLWKDWGTIAAITDTPTNINNIKSAKVIDSSIYMLDGKQVAGVNRMRKGFYIINGKKVQP